MDVNTAVYSKEGLTALLGETLSYTKQGYTQDLFGTELKVNISDSFGQLALDAVRKDCSSAEMLKQLADDGRQEILSAEYRLTVQGEIVGEPQSLSVTFNDLTDTKLPDPERVDVWALLYHAVQHKLDVAYDRYYQELYRGMTEQEKADAVMNFVRTANLIESKYGIHEPDFAEYVDDVVYQELTDIWVSELLYYLLAERIPEHTASMEGSLSCGLNIRVQADADKGYKLMPYLSFSDASGIEDVPVRFTDEEETVLRERIAALYKEYRCMLPTAYQHEVQARYDAVLDADRDLYDMVEPAFDTCMKCFEAIHSEDNRQDCNAPDYSYAKDKWRLLWDFAWAVYACHISRHTGFNVMFDRYLNEQFKGRELTYTAQCDLTIATVYAFLTTDHVSLWGTMQKLAEPTVESLYDMFYKVLITHGLKAEQDIVDMDELPEDLQLVFMCEED